MNEGVNVSKLFKHSYFICACLNEFILKKIFLYVAYEVFKYLMFSFTMFLIPVISFNFKFSWLHFCIQGKYGLKVDLTTILTADSETAMNFEYL